MTAVLGDQVPVIPRLDFISVTSNLRGGWPADPDRVPRSPFKPRPPLRRLRVVVDARVLDGGNTDQWSRERLLQGLLSHPYLQVVRYSDDGPPPDVATQEVPHGTPKAIGWVTPATAPANDGTNFWYSDGDHLVFTGYESSLTDWVSTTITPAYADLTGDDTQRRRRSDAAAMATARTIKPDLFITDRAHLLDRAFAARGLTMCDLRGGLAMIGLYLRSQNDHRIWSDPDGWYTVNLDREMFFWVGARELLPEAWRWVTACSQHVRSAQDDSLLYLALSAPERLAQVLKCRDDVHRELNQLQLRGRAGSEAIHAFENALMMLVATLDLTAVVAHRVLGISGSDRHAGWQNPGWVTKLPANLAALVAPGTPLRHALTVAQHLRNSIHGIALQGLGVHDGGGKPRRALMGLPRAKQAELMTAVTALGDPADWGIEAVRANEFHADPGVLLDRLLPPMCELLNSTMRETPVDQLANVSLTPADLLPPQEGAGTVADMFSASQRACIRALLGL
ncbi:hypothetical protein KOI35_45020 [Actinoplanes bogorensis]|uniref:Uncharacterized protein n=1 Tax=Paractinoplanes bogorensis TaxID=1610840 RepID=A0ABS5Z5Q4_9ACTN|nr:hypothetical protein [Actinoplanes bogorensis]MBU2670686.1 hypothetical protein [Actinoplanes bogorensis]